MTNRTNPKPLAYTAQLTAAEITHYEKAELIHCVDIWPGGTNRVIIEAVKADISKAASI